MFSLDPDVGKFGFGGTVDGFSSLDDAEGDIEASLVVDWLGCCKVAAFGTGWEGDSSGFPLVIDC